MRLVIQRVSHAEVAVDGAVIGAVEHGLCVLVGVKTGDTAKDADSLAHKAFRIRIFNDDAGKMNLSAEDIAPNLLVVSQFTLYADTSRGRRPSFIGAADPQLGKDLYERFVKTLRDLGGHVETGVFGAHMVVTIVNDGPVTIILDSEGNQ
jgi:D-tyrosyl-tRNA(Tyr) deacylase